MRRLLVLGVLVAAAAGCGGDDERTAEPAETTSTTESTTITSATVELIHLYKPGDDSGIGRDSDEEGTNCGVSGLTRPTSSLAFMEPGADVLLLDADGTIVDRDDLDVGKARSIVTADRTFSCVWRLTFGDIEESRFFQVEVDGEVVGTLEWLDLRNAAATGSTELYLDA